MEKVRAKFKCQSVEDFGSSKTVKLWAVYSDTGENADFTKATPSGELKICISESTPAIDFFKPQKDYYIDFTEAS